MTRKTTFVAGVLLLLFLAADASTIRRDLRKKKNNGKSKGGKGSSNDNISCIPLFPTQSPSKGKGVKRGNGRGSSTNKGKSKNDIGRRKLGSIIIGDGGGVVFPAEPASTNQPSITPTPRPDDYVNSEDQQDNVDQVVRGKGKGSTPAPSFFCPAPTSAPCRWNHRKEGSSHCIGMSHVLFLVCCSNRIEL